MSTQASSGVVRVLLVENDPAGAGRVRALLQEARRPPFTVEVVPAAPDTVAETDTRPYDAVLLGLSPEAARSGEGFAIIRHLDKTAPVVVLGDLDDDEVAVKAVKRGAQDYLVKDHLIPELLVRSHPLRARAPPAARRAEPAPGLRAEDRRVRPAVLPAGGHAGGAPPRHRRLPARQRPGRRRLLRLPRAAGRPGGPGGGRRVGQGHSRGDPHGRDPGHPARGGLDVRDADRARADPQPGAAPREEPGPLRHPLLRRADPLHRRVHLRQRRASAGAAARRRRRVGPRLDGAAAPALRRGGVGGSRRSPSPTAAGSSSTATG